MADIFTTKNKAALRDLITQAFDIYNAFIPGPDGEEALLALRDQLLDRINNQEPLSRPVQVEMPLGLLAYMMASAKHIGDMVLIISKWVPED